MLKHFIYSSFRKRYKTYIFFLVFLGYFLSRSATLYIYAQNCMTRTQVSSDSRCLYIFGSNVYEKGTRSRPHQGHTCGIDVSNFIPSFHTSGMAAYMDPNLVGAVCIDTPTPTRTPIPTATRTPTLTPTRVPSNTTTPTQTIIQNPTITPSRIQSPTATPIHLLGDINRDGKVTIQDLLQLVPNFSTTGIPGFSSSDILEDGIVDIFDLNIIDTNYGK